MKYIKRHLQVVEPKINDEGYYVVGNISIHPDVFHRDYQPLGFTLTAEEVEIVENALKGLKTMIVNTYCSVPEIEPSLRESRIRVGNLLTRIKQWQDEHNK